MSTAVLTYQARYEDVYQHASTLATTGPEWLRNLRVNALAQHQALGIPTPKNEEWKYTPLRQVAEMDVRPGEPGTALFDVELPNWSGSAGRIVLVNGRFDRNLSELPSTPGLTVKSMVNALIEEDGLLALNLGKVALTEDHTFAALNTALFEDGVLVHVGREVEVSEVLEIVHVTEGSGMVIAPRILIVAEENSRIQIVETYVTVGEAKSLTIPVTEVVVHPYGNVEHVRVQDEEISNNHIALWQVLQERDSEYRSYNVAFGAALGRTDQNIYLNGEHIVTRLDGVVVATGEQLLDNHTKLDHAKPNCNSFEIYKQIVDDNATVVFNGKIFVHQDAQKTDAKQTNQALLLSPNATIDSKPQLEIFADDVKCTHGATVGQLEELPLFYMKQRGIPHEQAQAILVYAFAAEVLELISNDSARRKLEDRLFTKLGIE